MGRVPVPAQVLGRGPRGRPGAARPGATRRYARTVRRVFVGVVGVALLVSGGCGVRVVATGAEASGVAATVPATATVATTTSTRLTMPPAECSAEGVRFAVVGGDSAMGLRELAFELVNCGTAPVTVAGYPDVRLFGEDHQPVTVAVERGDGSIATVPEFDNPPGEVTLQPGERARSGLLWRYLVTDSDLSKSVTAYYLEATAGPGRPWLDVPMVMPDATAGARQVTVDLGNTGKLGVRAWTKA